jgi:pseudouridine kinase
MESVQRVMPVVPAGAGVVVVGGANTDIIGVSAGPLVAHDSNPGHVTASAGGVGRNIAEILARTGVETHLVTAFGGDEAGRELAEACRTLGIGVEASLFCEDLPGARYLAVVGEDGDMAVAINDMRVLERLTTDALVRPACARLLAAAALVVVDTNLPADSLEWLATHVEAPIVLETVSAAKAPRAAGILPRLAAITPNALEAGVLLGREVCGLESARSAAVDLVALGVGAAFVTCGAEGVAWADGARSGTVDAPAVEVADATGAGDAFCAGVASALLAGAGAREAAATGSAIAGIALSRTKEL